MAHPDPPRPGGDRYDLKSDDDSGIASLVSARRRDRAQSIRGTESRYMAPQAEIEEAEDWVISYMDMVTLLMIVFLGMVAILMIEKKFDQLDARGGYNLAAPAGSPAFFLPLPAPGPVATLRPAEPEGDALRPVETPDLPDRSPSRPDPTAPARPDLPPAAAPGEQRLTEEGRRLLNDLANANLPPGVLFDTVDRQIRIQISDQVLFGSGQADLSPEGVKLVRRLVPFLNAIGGVISVEGHTDDIPIASPRFASNWELSAARAASVARLIQDQGVPAGRLRAVGYSDTRPVAAPPAGRAQNRRVTLVVEP